jgi:excisionase family DNA binding protein
MSHLDTDLLKPTEVARRLGVSRSWIYEAAKAGRIPCIRLGGPDGRVRFLPADVETWLEQARSAWLPGETPTASAKRAAARYGRRRINCRWTGSALALSDAATTSRNTRGA